MSHLNLTQSLPILEDYFSPSPWNYTAAYRAALDNDDDDDDDDVHENDIHDDDEVSKENADVFVEEIVGGIDLRILRKTLDKASSYFIKAGKTSLARQVEVDYF